jgi:hypothetical protein
MIQLVNTQPLFEVAVKLRVDALAKPYVLSLVKCREGRLLQRSKKELRASKPPIKNRPAPY